MTLHKVLKYLALVIGVIGLILLGRIIATGDDAIKASADLQGSHLDPYMWIAYLVLAAVVVLALVIWFISTYNRLVRMRENVNKSWADIDVLLKQRYDMIPNLE